VDAIAFACDARKAESQGLVYGVELEHRPDNQHDPNAIAVIGLDLLPLNAPSFG
jgi:hypothetical protein